MSQASRSQTSSITGSGANSQAQSSQPSLSQGARTAPATDGDQSQQSVVDPPQSASEPVGLKDQDKVLITGDDILIEYVDRLMREL